jgi:hypothetical protein
MYIPWAQQGLHQLCESAMPWLACHVCVEHSHLFKCIGYTRREPSKAAAWGFKPGQETSEPFRGAWCCSRSADSTLQPQPLCWVRHSDSQQHSAAQQDMIDTAGQSLLQALLPQRLRSHGLNNCCQLQCSCAQCLRLRGFAGREAASPRRRRSSWTDTSRVLHQRACRQGKVQSGKEHQCWFSSLRWRQGMTTS